MSKARSIALAAVVAGTMLGCVTEPEPGEPCVTDFTPWNGKEMPDRDMQVGDTAVAFLADHFLPSPAGICMRGGEFEASSSDPSAVAVSVPDTLVMIVALDAADSVRVTVKATSPAAPGPTGHEFLVRVRPR